MSKEKLKVNVSAEEIACQLCMEGKITPKNDKTLSKNGQKSVVLSKITVFVVFFDSQQKINQFYPARMKLVA
ncbi:MAG: hypothetical protein LBP85_00680 [Prevotellaceae bacterium]|jgi:hypothetical protein|nr:hypothetical protein [Prevotellaceae bacterium]